MGVTHAGPAVPQYFPIPGPEMYPILGFQGEYRFLSNFWTCAVWYDGYLYRSAEHAYMAAKTLLLAEREMIRSLPTAGQAKRAGRTVTLRPDWELIKIPAMTGITLDKFARNPALRKRLLGTGDRPLVELNTWGDRFWGIDGYGENWLGQVLMYDRQVLSPPVELPDGQPC